MVLLTMPSMMERGGGVIDHAQHDGPWWSRSGRSVAECLPAASAPASSLPAVANKADFLGEKNPDFEVVRVCLL